MEKTGRHLHTFTFWCHFILHIQKPLSLKDLTMNLGKMSIQQQLKQVCRYHEINRIWRQRHTGQRQNLQFWKLGKWMRSAKVARWKVCLKALDFRASFLQKVSLNTSLWSTALNTVLALDSNGGQNRQPMYASSIRRNSILCLYRTSLIHTKLWNGFAIISFYPFQSLVLLWEL